jgi:DNA-binding helix-hairpin-helix protein with protein kinase domain
MKLSDADGRVLVLGGELGRGGEGSVYELASNSSLVVKVYHKVPLPEGQLAKLRAMTAAWSPGLEKIAAWPRSILFDPANRQACGVLMSKMTGALQLHELYGTTNRRRHFPDAGWHHLVLAARNVAAAFNTLHSASIVLGDVNQGNMLVDSGMTVRMIDCDSFQITHGGQTYNCPVGSPHFTPPELQGLRLRDVCRTEDHDRFGLATLIFHLLFVGRHPFAGRYRGAGDMSIEKAIAERRFAFSRNKAATMVDPPPDSLLLDDLPPSVGELFESAFRTDGRPRPTPKQWIEQLDALLQARTVCRTDDLHVYASTSQSCPWCRIEDRGGPSFFFSIDAKTTVSSNRLARLEAKVLELDEVKFPQLPPERIAPPKFPPVNEQKPLRNWAAQDVASVLLIASWPACIVTMVLSLIPLVVTTAASVASAGYLLLSKRGRECRGSVDDWQRSLAQQEAAIEKRARMIQRSHRDRVADFEAAEKEFDEERTKYHAEREELSKLVVENRETQLEDYLRGHSIRDHHRAIAGLTQSHVAVLESYGVETANDLARLKLYGVPSIDSALVIELLDWGTKVKRKFVFKPEHGMTLDSLKSVDSAAVLRFKMSQAKKVLMGSERLRVLAEAGKKALADDLAEFDGRTRRWRKKAAQLWNHQRNRSAVERTINRAPVAILIALAAGILAFAWLTFFLLAQR